MDPVFSSADACAKPDNIVLSNDNRYRIDKAFADGRFSAGHYSSAYYGTILKRNELARVHQIKGYESFEEGKTVEYNDNRYKIKEVF